MRAHLGVCLWASAIVFKRNCFKYHNCLHVPCVAADAPTADLVGERAKLQWPTSCCVFRTPACTFPFTLRSIFVSCLCLNLRLRLTIRQSWEISFCDKLSLILLRNKKKTDYVIPLHVICKNRDAQSAKCHLAYTVCCFRTHCTFRRKIWGEILSSCTTTQDMK